MPSGTPKGDVSRGQTVQIGQERQPIDGPEQIIHNSIYDYLEAALEPVLNRLAARCGTGFHASRECAQNAMTDDDVTCFWIGVSFINFVILVIAIVNPK